MAQIFVLDSTTKTLKAALTANVATSNPEFTVAYADSNGITFTEGSSDGVLSNTANVTVVGAPAAGFRRVVKSLTIFNKDTAPVTVDLKYDNNGTHRMATKIPLSTNETFTLDGIYDSGGNLRTSNSRGMPYIATVNGLIYKGITNTLTITGGNFILAPATARFRFSGTIYDSSFTFTSPAFQSITVPASVTSLPANSTGTFQILDVYGRETNSVTVSVLDAPVGGNITQTGNTRIHIFTTSSTFTTNANISVRYLCVAGGGGGGTDMGGGGGAGGYLAANVLTMTAGSYTITVGSGGAGAPTGYSPSPSAGTNGQNSSIIGPGVSITSIGGGGGGSTHRADTLTSRPAGTGGSGGGSSGSTNNYAPGTPGQGNNGGPSNGQWYSGSGGGAGAAGVSTPGAGGVGIENDILGTNYFWAGGGGGGGYTTSGGAGGNGGGGGGAINTPAGGSGYNAGSSGGGGAVNTQANTPGGNAGTNTGGGGGGASHYNTSSVGGNGGSGIVVLRFTVV